MDSLQLFSKMAPVLEALPDTPKIFWYVSAGVDFRAPVFLTQNHINELAKNHGREFIMPELFVFNAMGSEVVELKQKLEVDGEVVLYHDYNTIIKAKNYQSLEVRDDISFETNPNYIDLEILNVNDNQKNTALYFELEISGHNYIEVQRVLYFQAENIDFFHKIILNNIFQTSYLCSTREGLSWGGCKKSIIDYIYKDNQPHFFSEHGFAPTFQILSNNYTKEIFKDATQNSDLSAVANYGNYISESEEYRNDSVIYKLAY